MRHIFLPISWKITENFNSINLKHINFSHESTKRTIGAFSQALSILNYLVHSNAPHTHSAHPLKCPLFNIGYPVFVWFPLQSSRRDWTCSSYWLEYLLGNCWIFKAFNSLSNSTLSFFELACALRVFMFERKFSRHSQNVADWENDWAKKERKMWISTWRLSSHVW